MMPAPAGRALLAALVVASCVTAPSPTPSPSASATPVASPSVSAGRPPDCAKGPPPGLPGPWWSGRVFYEAFVRSFADSDGDGSGDLAGLTARLDHLNDGDPATTDDLGVTGLWLMPIFDSPSYHGYDVVDYERIEPDYGDLDAFRTFLEAAHERGIAVILDLVINHTSRDHPWFRDALAGGQHRDWYSWSETDPGWPSVAGGSPWHASTNGWYYGAFWEGMPDLDLRNPAVTDELVRIAEHWLDLGVDGFRLDAAKHLIETGPRDQVNTAETLTWLAAFRERLHARHPEALILGEVWDVRPTTIEYVTSGALDLVFDFGIGPAAIGAAARADATTLVVNEREVAGRYPLDSVATFLTNHDQARVMTQLRDDSAAGLAAAALLTGPGVPFVYYGEEIGLAGDKPDERIRTPLPWTADAPGHGFTDGTPWQAFAADPQARNVATQATAQGSLLSAYRQLIALRSARPELAMGTFYELEAETSGVVAALRWEPDGASIVLQNLGSRDLAPVLGLGSGPLCGHPAASLAFSSSPRVSGVAAPEVTPAGGLEAYVPLARLPARSTVVIALDP